MHMHNTTFIIHRTEFRIVNLNQYPVNSVCTYINNSEHCQTVKWMDSFAMRKTEQNVNTGIFLDLRATFAVYALSHMSRRGYTTCALLKKIMALCKSSLINHKRCR